MLLIITADSWKFTIDKRKEVVCAFLDLRKAFDVIDHNTLVSKLSKQGLNENELEWFKSYLQGRTQFVSCGGVESERRLITEFRKVRSLVPLCSTFISTALVMCAKTARQRYILTTPRSMRVQLFKRYWCSGTTAVKRRSY